MSSIQLTFRSYMQTKNVILLLQQLATVKGNTIPVSTHNSYLVVPVWLLGWNHKRWASSRSQRGDVCHVSWRLKTLFFCLVAGWRGETPQRVIYPGCEDYPIDASRRRIRPPRYSNGIINPELFNPRSQFRRGLWALHVLRSCQLRTPACGLRDLCNLLKFYHNHNGYRSGWS